MLWSLAGGGGHISWRARIIRLFYEGQLICSRQFDLVVLLTILSRSWWAAMILSISTTQQLREKYFWIKLDSWQRFCDIYLWNKSFVQVEIFVTILLIITDCVELGIECWRYLSEATPGSPGLIIFLITCGNQGYLGFNNILLWTWWNIRLRVMLTKRESQSFHFALTKIFWKICWWCDMRWLETGKYWQCWWWWHH